MFKLIRKHQKKVLAFFGVGLMITFVVQTGSSYRSGGGSDPVVAHVNGKDVHYSELQNAKYFWSRLQHTTLKNVPQAGGKEILASQYLGIDVQELLNHDPDTFFLLQKEAEFLGLSPTDDQVNELMQNQTTLTGESPSDEVEATRRAFIALLQVQAAYERGKSAIKNPAPQRQYDIASKTQEMTLKAVVYDAAEFKGAVPAPTSEDLKKQFDKYSATLPDQPDSDVNPSGFGYKYPPRVMVECISIRSADLRDAVKKSKDDTTWGIEAWKEYKLNSEAYPATRPSAEDKSVASTQPSTQPTTRPLGFADYREQIMDELLQEGEAKLLGEVTRKLATTLQADWVAYRTAVGPATQPAGQPATTQPAAGPMTALGVPYGSPDYLDKLALAVQAETKVLPKVDRYARVWLNAKDLGDLPGIGGSFFVTDQRDIGPVPFATYLMAFMDQFGHVPNSRDLAPTISILSPSPFLADYSRNRYLFRVIAADPSHPATDMAPFNQQIEADWRLAAAVDKAKDAADKIVPLAKNSSLDAVAASLGKQVFILGPMGPSGPVDSKPAMTFKPESLRALHAAQLDLLKQPDAIKAGKAIAVVQLPRDGKVLVVSPMLVGTTVPPEIQYMLASRFNRMAEIDDERQFRRQWYDPAEVAKRLNFKNDQKDKSNN